MIQRFSKNYSLTTLLLTLLGLVTIVSIFLYIQIHNHYTKTTHQELLEHYAKQTSSLLIPNIQEHINDKKSLNIYLHQIIQSNSGIFHIGLTTQGRHYAHASASKATFKGEPFYFKEILPKYPKINLEVIINAKKIDSYIEKSNQLKIFNIALALSTLFISFLLIVVVLAPLKKLSLYLYNKTKTLNESQARLIPNETLSIVHSFKAISSSQREQKRSLKKLNQHLGEIIDAKTSSLKAEIEEKTKAKQELELSNEEKTVLLKEIHHRVKNNLAIIVGLIRMQSRRIDDPKTKSMFSDLQNRIKTMELIHTNLYASTQFNKITMKKYLASLVEHLSNTFAKEDEVIMFSVHCDEISMDIDKAITCGQIANELVTNAFKHAFKDKSGGHIWIQINDLGEHYELLVEDNGSPKRDNNLKDSIPKKFSLGLSLVHELVKYQLKGTVEVVNRGGLKYRIIFKK